MRYPGLAAGAWLPVLAALTLSGCGGSSSSPSSPSGAGGATPTTAPGTSVPASPPAVAAGSSFCAQVASLTAQFSNLGKSVYSNPGATPSVVAFQQLIAAVAAAADSLDSSAPSAIAPAFHTLRTAYDELSTRVQSATSVQQGASLFASIETQAVKDASATVGSYIKSTCGVSPSP